MPTPWPEENTNEALELLDQLQTLIEAAIETGLDDREAEHFQNAVIRLAELSAK